MILYFDIRLKPPPIKAFNAVPRFGHSSDITLIYDENGVNVSAAVDYVQGTLFVAGFCLVVFIIWILAILVLKCFGKRAGIAAGHPFIDNGGSTKRHMRFRIFMITSSLLIAISGIVFLVRGARSIGNAYDDIRDGSSGLNNIAKLIVNSTDEVIAFGENTVALRDNIVAELEQKVCTRDGSGGVADQFDQAATSVVNILTALQDFSKNELTDIRNTFSTEFNSISNDFSSASDTGESYSQPSYIAGPVIAFGLLLTLGAYLAWKGPFIMAYFATQTWVVLPIFSLIIVVIAIVLAVTGTVLVANSDVCLGGESKSPEGFMEIVIQKAGFTGDTLEATNYYIVNSCTGQYTRKIDAENLLLELNDGLDSISQLQALIENDSSSIKTICGVTDQRLSELNGVMTDSVNAFTDFVGITERAVDILQCDRINDIFVDFYHNALCTNIPYSLMWIFSTMMAVYILGMLIVVFRGALLPTVKTFDDTKGMIYDEDDSYYKNKVYVDPVEHHNGPYQSQQAASETDEGSHFYEDNMADTTSIEYSDMRGSQMRGYDFENNPMTYDNRND